MGQLRTAIKDLISKIDAMQPEAEALAGVVRDAKERIHGIAATADEGYNSIYLYLVGVFKEKKESIDAHMGDALSTVADGALKGLVKGTADWNATIKKRIGEVNTDCDATASKLAKLNQAAATESAKLAKIAEKKKAKLLKSKSYKEKIKGYLAALAEADKALDAQLKAVQSALKIKFKPDWVDKNYPAVALTWTVQEVKDRSTMDFQSTLTNYENDRTKYENHVRVFRDELKTIPNQLKMMKKWMEDADDMEKEGE